MKRPQEKIKDLVELQVFDEVQNVAADPVRAVAAYRFTDVTSDLIARWLDALADQPHGRGTARALAGSRGVGKSHTLAVFGALVAVPELRSTITEPHVATSARRLMSRRYLAVRVERGTRPTLIEELCVAFTAAFGGSELQWGDEPGAMLAVAASRALDATLLLVIDTSFGRETRVDRDDGPFLSELAAAARNVNAFVALALDDDIADANGINARLVATYQVDYLDPEHLYRIVDLFLLRKSKDARAALHDIYLTLRATVPGFNWSEPRFTALYPIHPLIADIAAKVRLYAPTFAFLPFASASSVRAVGRPALSLILLDEVFDRAEYDLRKSRKLQEAFTAYDELATKGMQQFPVMQRLQAKLVLKSLFILSLDGHGATASDLCAALLLTDPVSPARATERVDEVLMRFAEVAPPDMWERVADVGAARYRFLIRSSVSFDSALEASVKQLTLDDATLDGVLGTAARIRFEDWPFVASTAAPPAAATFHLSWRGSERPGRIFERAPFSASQPSDARAIDWQINLLAPSSSSNNGSHHDGDEATNSQPAPPSLPNSDDTPFINVFWQPAVLNQEESLALRRLHALRTDAALVAKFGETARAVMGALTAQCERIWTRVMMSDGHMIFNGVAHSFTDEARAAPMLSGALADFFTPLFDKQFSQHPTFEETLGDVETARLIEVFFGGANSAEPDIQRLISLFAVPLGLAGRRGQSYTTELVDEVAAPRWVTDVLALTDAADGKTVPLEVVSRALRRKPYGLLREAQHLVLAALVARRRVQLVTVVGESITRRAQGRFIKWDQIAGVGRAAVTHHSTEELMAWARLLTGNPALSTGDETPSSESIRVALAAWLDTWHQQRMLEKTDALPDASLTVRAWTLATGVRKTFGVAAQAIEAALADELSLEEGLQRVVDAFADSIETFARTSRQLVDLTTYSFGIAERERAHAYLATAEPTGEALIENARRELLSIAADPHSLFDDGRRKRFELLWHEFQGRYVEHYATVHDRTVGGASDRQPLDALLRGRDWREFEALSQLSVVNRQNWADAEELLKRVEHSRCDLPVRQVLVERSTCLCSFHLTDAARYASLSQELEDIAELGRAASRRTLSLFSKQLSRPLGALADHQITDAATTDRARALSDAFARGAVPE
ncbi:MAG: DUF6079 family protein, partial [Acidobacteriota bacterium]|nr:DUF6079 family protein [Acidobacteriota bacterium]